MSVQFHEEKLKSAVGHMFYGFHFQLVGWHRDGVALVEYYDVAPTVSSESWFTWNVSILFGYVSSWYIRVKSK